MKYYTMLKIGNLKLKSNLILAPMAGVSDLPFRMLNRKFGAELAFVEMINARSIGHKSKRTRSMLSSHPKDKPLGVQLLGCEEKFMLKALDVLKDYKFDLLDFNAACPAKKVVRRQEGAALLKEPKKLNKLLKLVVKHSQVPVTVKMRIGWDQQSINAKEVSLYAEDAGVSALFIHGRTKVEEYSGKVNYAVIQKVKKALNIPVIASGDILSAQLAKKMLDETNCDGLVIARGSFGNPWIFKEIREFLKSGKIISRPAQSEVIKVMLEHLNASIAFYGERNGVVIYRKFFGWYTKGFRQIRPLREKSSRVKNKEEMIKIIESI
ncbi:MAG: tRNA dihydrouridine synthase DusB [Candidatus Omnitrophota bacterium]|nr:tRNA dihydrouridine synthase DusB [Candidatus Omnitrophota bacterium]